MKYLNSQKGIAPIIAVIIIAILAVFGGAYYFKQYQTKQVSSWVNQFESSSIKWKTFSIKDVKNSEDHYIEFSTDIEQVFPIPMYGIQFSLPPVEKGTITNAYNPSKSPVIDFSPKKELTICNQYGYYYQQNNPVTSGESAMEIRVPIHKIANAKEWYDGCIKPINYPKGTPTTETNIVNGNDVLIARDNTQWIYDQYIFVKNNIVYIFDFDNREPKPEDQQQIQQILESVKFSQPTINLP